MTQSNETLPAVIESPRVALGTLEASSAGDLVAGATVLADALRDVIRRQHLTVQITGKEYVKAEGWLTLGTMLGVLPQEVSNVRQEDGGYIATVELVSMQTGRVVARATAEVGMDEPAWAHRPAFARRSMAATRATSKAARLAFGWVMALAGYEATPAEEMEATVEVRPAQPAPPAPTAPRTPRRPSSKSAPMSMPGAEHTVGVIDRVSVKEGTKKDGSIFVRYGALVLDEWYGTFDSDLGQQLAALEGRHVRLAWKPDGKFRTAVSVQPWSENVEPEDDIPLPPELPPELEDDRLL